ncbi:hypothetical protein [Aliarcobacter cryaerophilus]|uniref:hypothetical protein n=1 Tax=Aliarcobacter cryaerophilus TaxID=28198 RepID=UPI00105704B3|nr:hypothetical protein [Aliarcobacter cryaerophilus]
MVIVVAAPASTVEFTTFIRLRVPLIVESALTSFVPTSSIVASPLKANAVPVKLNVLPVEFTALNSNPAFEVQVRFTFSMFFSVGLIPVAVVSLIEAFSVSLSVVDLSWMMSLLFNVPTVPVTVSSPVVISSISAPVVNVPVPLI